MSALLTVTRALEASSLCLSLTSSLSTGDRTVLSTVVRLTYLSGVHNARICQVHSCTRLHHSLICSGCRIWKEFFNFHVLQHSTTLDLRRVVEVCYWCTEPGNLQVKKFRKSVHICHTCLSPKPVSLIF